MQRKHHVPLCTRCPGGRGGARHRRRSGARTDRSGLAVLRSTIRPELRSAVQLPHPTAVSVPGSVRRPAVQSSRGRQPRLARRRGIQSLDAGLADALKLPDSNGALVSNVQSGSPAATAGIKAGDVILSVDGRATNSARDLAAEIRRDAPNTKVTVTLMAFRCQAGRHGHPRALCPVPARRRTRVNRALPHPRPLSRAQHRWA